MEEDFKISKSDEQIGGTGFILARNRPIFKTTIVFKNKETSTVKCNEWPEVRDGWVIIAVLDNYETRAKKRYYYKKEDIISLSSIFIGVDETE
jgi:hypothetical protein